MGNIEAAPVGQNGTDVELTPTEDTSEIDIEPAEETERGIDPEPDSVMETVTRESDQHTELRAWLLSLDQGQGALLGYIDIIKEQFDADFNQLRALVNDDTNNR